MAFSSVDALAVSAIPPPVLNDVAIDAAVVLANNSGFAYYHYNYSITNPGTNTGNIVSFRLDVSRGSDSQSYNYGNLSMPFGLTTKTFGELYDSRQDPKGMIPFGFNLPSTWWGTIGGSGLAIANGSGLGGEIPPGFTQNNIINDNYNDLNIDDKLNLHKDEEFLPELKKINEFYHNVNGEVVK